jgi:hypothetical protein
VKKLSLNTLRVDTFATTSGTSAVRGTVAGYQTAQCTIYDCPESYGGTCWITCFDTCPCSEGPDCA